MLHKESISVVMPSYNESANIAEAIERISATLGESLLEIIIVDDNSPDRTWEIVEHLKNPRARAIRRMDKRGLASALADGTRAAKGKIVVWLDCDLGIPPEDIALLVSKLDEYDVAIGSRYLPGGKDTRNKFRAFLSTVFNTYTRLVLGRFFWDWTSGFAAARREVLQEVPLSEEGFGEYFIEWVYACSKRNFKMVEVPYHYGLRKGGVSKTDSSVWVFLKLSVQYALRVLQIRMRGGRAPKKQPTIITRTTCRVCGSSDLHDLYSLGNLYVSDFVDRPDQGIKAPLDMIMCEHCSLVQLRHTAPQEFMYTRFYWYRSGVTDTMKAALKDITQNIEKRVDLKPGDIVLDIGSNDGTMLRLYEKPGIVRVGVEPASNLAEEGRKDLDFFINDFWTRENYEKVVPRKAKVITAIGMFYDMEDPNQFIRDAALCLEDDGIFVAQLMCLKNMLDTNDVGNICHEHLEFYSLSSLEFLLERNGLKVIDIEHNLVNGGSYRVYACLENATLPTRPRARGREAEVPGARERMERFRGEEKGFTEPGIHKEFFRRIEENKKKCVDFIRAEVQKGKKVWVYGASTKGNTILQYYGLNHADIEAASERSPEKWGKFTVGTGIPIVSEDEARKAKPDYFLVLPYAFFDEFYKREEEWRRGGGKFIVPLPEFRVVP